MQEQRSARKRRLALWFTVNLIVFVLCYLNYRLQLKHRYLYKLLSTGLCLSRAAAMVINFNLMLVWLPMCKYTLTRLAWLASQVSASERRRLGEQLLALIGERQRAGPTSGRRPGAGSSAGPDNGSAASKNWPTAMQGSAERAIKRLGCALAQAKIKSIDSFLVAVDHCTSLHTICATTITLASVVHTAAHLMNVINFSKHFDPLLGNLNMADHKGQNPLLLLVSVPGITGCIMMIILLLMSLSSIHIIRNSSFDLFQVFHRLSILFVVLLILHPSSHVLKEQSNVDRHHPELCHITSSHFRSLAGQPKSISNFKLEPKTNAAKLGWLPESGPASQLWPTFSGSPPLMGQAGAHLSSSSSSNNKSQARHGPELRNTRSVSSNNHLAPTNTDNKAPGDSDAGGSGDTPLSSLNSERITSCLDERPKFVAQSSLCWLVLGVGLSFYLFDLALRRVRRSKCAIELLAASASEKEASLIELVLCSNHKRFNTWLPGQFVYLNCPQVASYEWHPFTISSMDHERRQFTLHIKAGGDWTARLRDELRKRNCLTINGGPSIEWTKAWSNFVPAHQTNGLGKLLQLSSEQMIMNNDVSSAHTAAASTRAQSSPNAWRASVSALGVPSKLGAERASWRVEPARPGPAAWLTGWPSSCVGGRFCCGINTNSESSLASGGGGGGQSQVAGLDCIDRKTGRLQVECKRLVRVRDCDELAHCFEQLPDGGQLGKPRAAAHCLEPNLKCWPTKFGDIEGQEEGGREASDLLELYVDGPFHSPFERLLEQQVSICISNGVGWTAFSSVFQCVKSGPGSSSGAGRARVWCSKWAPAAESGSFVESPAKGRAARVLYLKVIVTNLEQLRPFYELASSYFASTPAGASNSSSSIKQVSVHLTRASIEDENVRLFCERENLSPKLDSASIKVNEVFTIELGKPKLADYLEQFGEMYSDRRKISVYCCGSHQVKQLVKDSCRQLNEKAKLELGSSSQQSKAAKRLKGKPIFCYHEENF